VKRQHVLELEPLGGLGQAAALEQLLGLDPLLGRPHADPIAHGDLETARSVQGVDDFRERALHHGLADAGDHGDDGDALFAGRDPRHVTRRRLRSAGHGARRVGLEYLIHAQPTDRGLGASQNLARLGMAKLAALAEQRQLETGLDAIALANAQRDG